MSIIISDDFESYAIGDSPSHPPFGSWDTGINTGQGGVVVAGGPFTGSAKAFQLGLLRKTVNSAKPFITVQFDKFINAGNNPTGDSGIFTGSNVETLHGLGPRVFLLGLTFDQRLFVSAFNQDIGISQDAIHFDTWYRIILNVTAASYNLGGPDLLSLKAKVYIEGKLQFDNTILTGQPLSIFPSNSAGSNRFTFLPATIGGSTIDNISITDTIDDPVVSLTPARVAQELVEVVVKPPRTGQIAQELVELVVQPNNRFAYIAQELIELVVRDAAIAPGGWKVYEA